MRNFENLMQDGKTFFVSRFPAQRNGFQTGLTEVAVSCSVVDQAHGDVPASSSPPAGVAGLLTLQVVPGDIPVRLLHHSHSKVGCFQKIK